jgi:asparagine synthase (glutamine-hydrolysing)
MCGISGIIDLNNKLGEEKINNILKGFNKILHHRGPDDNGTWVEKHVGLAHTRLSIIDLSKNGHQPMISRNKKTILSYNGEIYNFRDLQQKLINKDLRSNSDTEVLLEYYNEYGVDNLIEKANGMFAFSIYDKIKNQLILARDKVGKKPLYYYHDNEYFIWGSEINIFKHSPIINKLKINHDAIGNYFNVGYIPNPLSIFDKINKIQPGEVLKLDLIKKSISKDKKRFINNQKNLINNSFEETIRDSVKIRTISDVPYGVFLSSGLDSSLVAATLKDLNKNVDSFSIGIKNNDLIDESTASRRIAKTLGLNHNELILDEKSLINYFPKITKAYGEPFADTSQIPTLILSEFAKKKITVALSGDGGDELFCGYNRYLYLKKNELLLKAFFKINNYSFSRKLLKMLVNLTFLQRKDIKIFSKLRVLENSKSFEDIYSKLVKIQSSEIDIFKDGFKKFKNFYLKNQNNPNGNYLVQMQNKDVENYLPDDILTKVDRASMQNSLEVRCPLLDFRLSSAIFENDNHKIKDGQSKIILRNMLKKFMDINLISKDKKGFAIPIKNWLNDGLFELVNDSINSNILKNDEFLDYKKLKLIWRDHNDGKSDSSNIIWSTLVYLQWKNEWIKN